MSVARTNEHGIPTNPPNPLVESSTFCVRVLYPRYCVKCKTSIEIKDPQNVTLKNGKPAVKGVCPNCGTSVFRIGKA